jgi:hypothetical protein
VIVLTTVLLIVFSSCEKKKAPFEPDIVENDTTTEFPSNFDYNQIVISIKPADSEKNVSHKVLPEIEFKNSPKFDSLVINNLKCKVIIDSISITLNGEKIEIDTNWKTSSLLQVIPKEYLKPNNQYQIFFEVHYEIDSLGKWIVPELNSYYETYEVDFNTINVSTTSLETDNIKYTYPIQNQYHYLQDEYHGGFIQLKTPQNEFFNTSGNLKQFKIRVSSGLGYNFETNASYSEDNYQISFDMPYNLSNESIYNLELIMTQDKEEAVLLSYHFRTSKFNRFEQKSEGIINSEKVYWHAKRIFVHLIYVWYQGFSEYLDKFEMDKIYGLIKPELEKTTTELSEIYLPRLYNHIDEIYADFDRNNLSREQLKSIGYDSVTIDKIHAGEIDLNEHISIPPVDAMYLSIASNLPFDSLCLNEEHILNNSAPKIEVGSGYSEGIGVYCNLADIGHLDWDIAQNWVCKNYTWNDDNNPEWVKWMYLHTICSVSNDGTWNVILKYTLPNGMVTSEKKVTWYGPSY